MKKEPELKIKKQVNNVTLDAENSYWQQGYDFIAGVDEVGRGPLAGPVVCAGVIFPKNIPFIEGINDSKKLNKLQREIFFFDIIQKAIEVSISIIDENTIDQINIYRASIVGMKYCITNFNTKPNLILVDGVYFSHPPYHIKNIIKGDAQVMSIAAASIIAKVIRDNIMNIYHYKYKQYGFNKNSGYPTKLHIEAIKKYGVLPIHRKSYRPVKLHMK